MSEQVKRYDVCRAAIEGVTKMPLGRFVTHDDYAALRAENEALRRERLELWDAIIPPRPRCRDCADSDGTCTTDDKPCEPHLRAMQELTALRAKLEAAEKERDGLFAAIAEAAPRCSFCDNPATCYGKYSDHPAGFACDECCGHGCEDGHCDLLPERTGR